MQRLFSRCVFRVGSDPTASPCLCAGVVGPLGELQKSGKDLALLKWWAVVPQSRAELRHSSSRRGFSSGSPSSCSHWFWAVIGVLLCMSLWMQQSASKGSKEPASHWNRLEGAQGAPEAALRLASHACRGNGASWSACSPHCALGH